MANLRSTISLWNGIRAFFDREAPGSARIAAAAGLLYAVFPFDLAPDVVPIFGWIDDVAVVSILLAVASRIWSSRRAPAEARVLPWPPRRGLGR